MDPVMNIKKDPVTMLKGPVTMLRGPVMDHHHVKGSVKVM